MYCGNRYFYYIINSSAEGTINATSGVRAKRRVFAKRKQFNDTIKLPLGKADSDEVAAKAACGFPTILLYHILIVFSRGFCYFFEISPLSEKTWLST